MGRMRVVDLAAVAIIPEIAPGLAAGGAAVLLRCWYDLPPTASLVAQASAAFIM